MLQLNKTIAHLIAALLGSFILGLLPAFAGDIATLDVIGYSEDGRYFAFEEYGVQDGSGFAYSHIIVVDVAEDRWVLGTPIDVQADQDNASLYDVRTEARAMAQPRLESLGIYWAADVLAYIGSGALDTDGLTLNFGVPPLLGSTQSIIRHTLSLEIFKASSAAPCMDWFGEIGMGYSLRLIQDDGSTLIHADDVLPRSRGCPVTYKITGVFAPLQATDLKHAVAVISVYPRGFEGPDRRFIAVPIGNQL